MGRVEHQPRRRGCRGDAMEEKRGMKQGKQKRSVSAVCMQPVHRFQI